MNYSKTVWLIATVVVLAGACNQVAAQLEHYDLTAEEFAAKSDATPSGTIIDVRTAAEYEKGHLNKAVNVDWNAPDFKQKSTAFNKEKPLFVYCLSGGRSAAAARQLRQDGFKNVYELTGGFIQWRSKGLPEASSKSTGGLDAAKYAALLHNSKMVLIDFYADWCAPCKKMKPYLDEIGKTQAQKVTIHRINADDNPELCKSLQIKALPTLLLYKGEKVVWRQEGFVSKEALQEVLQRQ